MFAVLLLLDVEERLRGRRGTSSNAMGAENTDRGGGGAWSSPSTAFSQLASSRLAGIPGCLTERAEVRGLEDHAASQSMIGESRAAESHGRAASVMRVGIWDGLRDDGRLFVEFDRTFGGLEFPNNSQELS